MAITSAISKNKTQGSFIPLTVFAKNIIIVLLLGFASANILSFLGYANLLVVSFSMALTLMSADGFLTLFALKNGALEVNPIIGFLNKKIGDWKGILISRFIGFLILSVGLLANNPYFCLVIAWLFCMVVCLNSATLASSRMSNTNINTNVKDTSNSDNKSPDWSMEKA